MRPSRIRAREKKPMKASSIIEHIELKMIFELCLKRELIRVRHIQIIVGLCYLVCIVCSRSVLWMIDRIEKFAHKNRLRYYVGCTSGIQLMTCVGFQFLHMI